MIRSVVWTGVVIAATLTGNLRAADPAEPITDADAWAVLPAYDGPTGAVTTTMLGKVFCGYQGWFNAPGDGSGLGWKHWAHGDRFEPGKARVDLWPDVSDLPADERVATPYRFADGSTAYVFSSHNAATVRRHFAEMQTYGIDGALVQRFGVETRDPPMTRHRNAVLAAARAGANETNRAYAVMYDLSGLGRGETSVVIDDWKRLVDRAKLTRDATDGAYLRHNGKPVVVVWGVGFADDRRYTLDDCERLIDFLKHDPTYGGNTVMLGVPAYWRTMRLDAVDDPALHRVLAKADILSPWTVGRFDSPDGATRYANETFADDQAWLAGRNVEIMPVIFPGFSWHNMNRDAKADQIPRLGGAFLWTQAAALKRAGASMLYVAMYDEVDEATAIFKLATTVPVNGERFVNEPNVRPDHYLWLTGQIGRLLRGERPIAEAMPER